MKKQLATQKNSKSTPPKSAPIPVPDAPVKPVKAVSKLDNHQKQILKLQAQIAYQEQMAAIERGETITIAPSSATTAFGQLDKLADFSAISAMLKALREQLNRVEKKVDAIDAGLAILADPTGDFAGDDNDLILIESDEDVTAPPAKRAKRAGLTSLANAAEQGSDEEVPSTQRVDDEMTD